MKKNLILSGAVLAALIAGLTACSPQAAAPAAAPPASAPTPGDPLAGRRTYQAICIVCHGAQGVGVPGAFPPLAGSEIAIASDPSRIIRIVLHGLNGPITVKGASFQNVMPPQGAALTDEQIADVLTFVRQSWGNNAPAVTVEAVAAIRTATATRSTSWTWEELTKSAP
jgi:mono/diheme cytochrome c family protein